MEGLKLLRFVMASIAILIALALTITAALACTDSCYNEDAKPFCGTDQETCSYISYDDNCDAVVEADSDNDGWTDTCDAFPEDATEWIDLDGDSYGHNVDCNDLDNTLNPGAEDICEDGIDQDCDGEDAVCPVDTDEDGVYDDEDNCVYDSNANQADMDSDGIGDACDDDKDGDEDPNDCDDTDASVFSGATEVCNDDVDNDCDGRVDEGCSSGGSSHRKTTTTHSSGGSWTRCEPEWECVSDCDAMTISCVDKNECSIELNKPTEPECPVEEPAETEGDAPEPAFVEEFETPSSEPETEAKENEVKKKTEEDHEALPIVGNAVRDTGKGKGLWPFALPFLLLFIPWKKCGKCRTRNGIFRSKCTKCNKTFYKVKKSSLLYKVRHLPFMNFR